MTLIGGLRTGLGGVRTTGGPSDSSGGDGGTADLFDLPLSYGDGISTDQQLPAATSFWLTPTTTADLAVAGQVREWYSGETAIAFLALSAVVNSATLAGACRFVVTINGFDSALSVTVPAGVTTGAILTASANIAVPAGSTIGVRFDGANAGASDSLRAEVRLRGAASGSPTIPDTLPTGPLALFRPHDLAVNGASWIDSVVGHVYNLSVPVIVGVVAPVRTLDGSFNNNPYALYSENAPPHTTQMLSTTVAMFAGGLVPQPRTFVAVIKPSSGIGGAVGVFKRLSTYFGCDLWLTAGNQFAYDNGGANNSQLSTPINYGGDEIVCIWRTDGVTIDLFVDAVKRAASTNTVGPEQGAGAGFTLGNNEAFGALSDRGFQGGIAFGGVWARRFTDAEVLSATNNLAGLYISP